MTEQELVERARQGDSAAFEQLVRDNQSRVYSLAVRLTGDREEAYDLSQEAFLRAWRRLPDFRGESGFSTWIHRLTTNVCIDFLRQRGRRREAMPVVSLDDEDAWFQEPADRKQDPQLRLEQAELGRAIQRGLENLSPPYREILVLREISGLSYQEISETTGLDLGTVKSRLARARLRLAKEIREGGNIPPGPASKRVSRRK